MSIPPRTPCRLPLTGAGLGLRRDFLTDVLESPPDAADFFEIAPENWLRVGGRLGRSLRTLTERSPFVAHGLSLSLGGPCELDEALANQIKQFLDAHGIDLYSEHLSYCDDGGHLYDLMPLPFTEEAVKHIARRIRQVQDILERRIAIENISYYVCGPGSTLSEIDFLTSVLAEADCNLHLDLNNIYVNSVNHGYDPVGFLRRVPGERIVYAHVAGHDVEAANFLVDTHGAPVIDSVWNLLDQAYSQFGVFPTLLERDFNIPPLTELLEEVRAIRVLQKAHMSGYNGHD